MPKRNWNDINDSDSSLSSASDDEVEVPKISKQMSAPPALTISKLRNACDEMSLRKIDQHTSNDVWLYIPNSFYQRCEEVNAILDKRPELKKVSRVKDIGWNVLTTRETGRRLIEEGHAEQDLFVKFIYSNRNEDRNTDERNKNQKKVTYVEKVTSPVNAQKEEQNEQPMKVESKKPQPAETVEEKKTDRQDKKKVKWVEKSKSIKEDDSKTPLASYQQLKSPPKHLSHIQSEKLTHTSPKKWEQARSPKPLKEPTQAKTPKRFKEKEPAKVEDQKAIQKAQIKQQEKVEPPKEEQAVVIVQEQLEKQNQVAFEAKKVEQARVEADVQSSDESLEKQKKKKKKKPNKKLKQARSDKPDLNPYSYFMK